MTNETLEFNLDAKKKYVIFSDTHLTKKFDARKYEFLKNLLVSCDQVIINGDFIDGYFVDLKDFISSKWSGLFHLLLEKDAIFIVGNHDRVNYANPKLKVFSRYQAKRVILKGRNNVYRVEHGHEVQGLVRTLEGALPRIFTKIFLWFFYFFESLGVKVFGSRFRRLMYFGDHSNKKRAKIAKKLGRGEIMVCGHTHMSMLDLKSFYINLGDIEYGKLSFGRRF